MKKHWYLVLPFLMFACRTPNPAPEVEGTYNGTFSVTGVGSGQGTVALTAIGDDKLRLNFSGAGVDPILVNGVTVNEQTDENYGLTYVDQIYTLAGAVDISNTLTFQYTGDTLFMTFTGTP